MLDRALKWLEPPANLLMWIAVVATVLMMLHVSIDVIGRSVFNAPLDGTTEIVAAYYMVVIALAPWGWLARNDGHIVAEIFQRLGSERVSFWIEIGAKIVTVAFLSLFCWQTYVKALNTTAQSEAWQAGVHYIPVWPSRWVLPLSGGIMLIYLVLRIFSDISRRRSGAETRRASC
jgi:TRAP-type C4-dicarboxylate transport system permease small subunit